MYSVLFPLFLLWIVMDLLVLLAPPPGSSVEPAAHARGINGNLMGDGQWAFGA